MGTVHDLIERQGKQAALLTELDRRAVEAAAAYMADEDNGIGFLYSGWCQAALPHRRLPDDKSWQIETERVGLIVQPGMRMGSNGVPEPVGIPFGSRARLIMLYLQSEALRTKSREIALGSSLRNWFERMGIPAGGKSIRDVREQSDRISRCRLTFLVQQGNRTGMMNQNIVDTAMFLDGEGSSQGSLFVETARLSEAFYDQLQRHPVPLEEAAIRAINNNSMSLDIYAWLAYRLHVLDNVRPVSWKAIKDQFGTGFARMDNFRVQFRSSLSLALAVYRDAKVEDNEKGLLLHPSRPPVAPRTVSMFPGKPGRLRS